MPTYEYECESPQHHRFERYQRFADPPVESCAECGAPVHRVLHPVGLVFKGPGFFRTDNRAGGATAAADADADGSADAKPADGKPADGKAADGKPADGKAASTKPAKQETKATAAAADE